MPEPINVYAVDGTPGVVNLVIPTGPALDMVTRLLNTAGWTMAGPIPYSDDPTPTYVLQPLYPLIQIRGADD